MVASMHDGDPSGQMSPVYGTCGAGRGGSRPITGSSGFGLIRSAAAGAIEPARTRETDSVRARPKRARRMALQRRRRRPGYEGPSTGALDEIAELLEHHLGELDREEVGAIQLVI